MALRKARNFATAATIAILLALAYYQKHAEPSGPTFNLVKTDRGFQLVAASAGIASLSEVSVKNQECRDTKLPLDTPRREPSSQAQTGAECNADIRAGIERAAKSRPVRARAGRMKQ